MASLASMASRSSYPNSIRPLVAYHCHGWNHSSRDRLGSRFQSKAPLKVAHLPNIRLAALTDATPRQALPGRARRLRSEWEARKATRTPEPE